ncbi:MAG: sulfite exporter TauE/SafE family protein [Deltaproteobacteria bacterium]|nr:sulfite exporter TauE/SafE family protein [Deltaproteobacteria bacterium]
MNLPVLLIVIFSSSLILTMIGLGGGLIFSPLFVLLGFTKSMAAATSLFLNGIAAASASIVYCRKGMVDFSVSLPLIITSSLGAPLGAMLTYRVNLKLFVGIMAAVIFLAALRMLFSVKVTDHGTGVSQQRKVVGGGIIGLVIGFLAGLLGIGGGVFVVPLLIYFLGLSTKIAAASSMFIVCFSSLTGFITHASITTIDWSFVLPAAACSFAGGQIGSRIMAERLRGRTIRIIFAIVLLALSAKLFHRVFM